MAWSERDVLEEVHKRTLAAGQAQARASAYLQELFDKQRAFVLDPARNKGALCTRRAGKTTIWPRYTAANAELNPRSLQRIWCISRLRAKQLFWQEFKYLFEAHNIPINSDAPNSVKMHETELTIRFANGAEIRLLGADKDKEAQKKRGDKTLMEVIIESQLFGPFLKTLVEEVAEPCLFDLQGTFCMEGTPGPLCTGYWYEVSGREDFKSRWESPGDNRGLGKGWSMHRWSLLDNPHLPHARKEIERIKIRKGWDDAHPTYQREYLGKWVNDLSALFYAFDEKRNTFTLEEVKPWGPGWSHSLGWDLGSLDAMAITVWGWHPAYPHLYEAFSWKKPGALSQEIVAQIEQLEYRGFNIVKQVADTGGGGKMFVEEVMSRYSQVFEAAKKTDKYDHVRLFNDELRTGRIMLQRGSLLAGEMAALPIEPDWLPYVQEREDGLAIEATADAPPSSMPKEDPRYPNHNCDAGLYAWRAAYHFLHTLPDVQPIPGTPEHEKKLEDQFVDQINRNINDRDREWWESDGNEGGLDGPWEDD